MPGDVDLRTSEGTNRLIRDGAFPVLDPDDLIEELDLVYGLIQRPRKESPAE
jgi:predicted Rossmann fold nucleotide-binding protein DprA/Smf involved in DNA uptake